ncbi:MAG: SRPBCC family protein [Cyanobacteria bacterium SZAS LIN-3]|nr:SRPBCC family protein [Cyanobacteria bacterium SZAS LIN-3]
MAPETSNRTRVSIALAALIAVAGFCGSMAAPDPVAAQNNKNETTRTAKLSESPEASSEIINKQLKSTMGNMPINLAALYEYDPPNVKLSKASTDIVINAPQQYVWDKLTSFHTYPKLFPRLKTCQVVKKEGDLILIESLLKPQMFVTQPCQHTINDLEDKPDSLKWKLTDGNFKAVEGEWKLKSIDDGQHTQVKYTMEVDPGPLIPRPVIVMALKMIQREAVSSVKSSVEQEYAAAMQAKGRNISNTSSTVPHG